MMTIDEMHVAVANWEFPGLAPFELLNGMVFAWSASLGRNIPAPLYASRLDAMAMVIGKLNAGQMIKMVCELGLIISRDQNSKSIWELACGFDEKTIAYAIGSFLKSTAIQQLEAVCRALWPERWENQNSKTKNENT